MWERKARLTLIVLREVYDAIFTQAHITIALPLSPYHPTWGWQNDSETPTAIQNPTLILAATDLCDESLLTLRFVYVPALVDSDRMIYRALLTLAAVQTTSAMLPSILSRFRGKRGSTQNRVATTPQAPNPEPVDHLHLQLPSIPATHAERAAMDKFYAESYTPGTEELFFKCLHCGKKCSSAILEKIANLQPQDKEHYENMTSFAGKGCDGKPV